MDTTADACERGLRGPETRFLEISVSRLRLDLRLAVLAVAVGLSFAPLELSERSREGGWPKLRVELTLELSGTRNCGDLHRLDPGELPPGALEGDHALRPGALTPGTKPSNDVSTQPWRSRMTTVLEMSAYTIAIRPSRSA
jgi:hypothetical protein